MPHAKASKLSGVLTAIVTPFDEGGKLALQHVPKLVEFQKAAGIDGLVVCGTNGEGTSLSVEERMRTLEAVMSVKGDMLIVAGTGAANTPDAVALTRHAAEVGADGVLVLPPFFFKNPSHVGVADAFKPVLDAADIPVLLYSIPQMSAIRISDETLALLAYHPNLSGLKDSSGDAESARHYITEYRQLRMFAGSDRLVQLTAQLNGAGSITGGANGFPDLVMAARHAALSGDAEATDKAQAKLNTMMDILVKYPLIAVNKSVMKLRGLPPLSVRPTLVNLTAQQEESLHSELVQAGLL